mgnify:CR=1 FL=1|jgi:hypothetical protein
MENNLLVKLYVILLISLFFIIMIAGLLEASKNYYIIDDKIKCKTRFNDYSGIEYSSCEDGATYLNPYRVKVVKGD